MELNLANKLALISGSTAGIGYAIAEALAREGALVIVNGRSQASVDDALSRLKATNGNVVGFAGDLSTAQAAEQLAKEFPELEILVNTWASSSQGRSRIFRMRIGGAFLR
jgi:NAD(P)-dependent dehydrogenase (short-subunit alcohol dehydrogenase family)